MLFGPAKFPADFLIGAGHILRALADASQIVDPQFDALQKGHQAPAARFAAVNHVIHERDQKRDLTVNLARQRILFGQRQFGF